MQYQAGGYFRGHFQNRKLQFGPTFSLCFYSVLLDKKFEVTKTVWAHHLMRSSNHIIWKGCLQFLGFNSKSLMIFFSKNWEKPLILFLSLETISPFPLYFEFEPFQILLTVSTCALLTLNTFLERDKFSFSNLSFLSGTHLCCFPTLFVGFARLN